MNDSTATKWSKQDLADLRAMAAQEFPIEAIADIMDTDIAQIRAKLRELSLLPEGVYHAD